MGVLPDGQQDKDEAAGGNKPEPGKTFTQDEVNSLVGKTRKEVAEKYGDYKLLKEKADKFDKVEEDRLSDAEKAKKEKEAAEARADAAIKTANQTLLKAACIAEAAKYGAKIPADAYALALADGAQISVGDDGNVVGVAEAVKALIDAGRLPLSGKGAAPGLDGGAGGQSRPGKSVTLTDEQKRMAGYANMTEEQYIQYAGQASVPFVPDSGTPKSE